MRKIELAIAIAGSLIVIGLSATFALHAGALWRDECNTIALATMPTLRDVCSNLQFDSFPLLWLLVIRGMGFLCFTGDGELRTLGFFVGCGLLGTLWLNAWAFRRSVPILSLGLVSLSPSILQWGDSMRAYGFGMITILLALPLIWRLSQTPTKPLFVMATLAAIASVQTIYHNAFLLFALCVSGMVVAARRGAWRPAIAVGGAGFIAAVSLTPYQSVFRKAGAWNVLVQIPNYDLEFFLGKLGEALAPAGIFTLIAWVVLYFVAVITAGSVTFMHGRIRFSAEEQDRALFFCVTLIIAPVVYFLFLRHLSYLTQPWYYLALLALVGVAIGESVSLLSSRPALRGAYIGLAAVLLFASVPRALQVSRTRFTNIDVIAADLHQRATANDFILVNPWYCGITFNRYFSAPPCPWETLPPIASHRFHRYDLVKTAMMAQDQEQPVRAAMDKIASTLQAGNRVFLVGGLRFLHPGESAFKLPPAPGSRFGWMDGPYYDSWSTQAAAFIQQHAARAEALAVACPPPVNGFENANLIVVSGWR